MIRHPKIAAHTRYAFICIGLMMLSFLIYVVLAVFDLGLDMSMRIALTRFALILILLFAFLGGVFSIWVAVLRKKMGGMT
ncbi:cytochrome b6 [Neisseria sp. CP9]|jgi:cytochrome b6|uniref:cytochrome b6 n=1 Tax=Neisseria sp. CP9 TaxID=3388843 RepID=UPI0039F0E4DE